MTFVLNLSRTFIHYEEKFSRIKQEISEQRQDIAEIKPRQRLVESPLSPLYFQDMLPLRPYLGSTSTLTLFYMKYHFKIRLISLIYNSQPLRFLVTKQDINHLSFIVSNSVLHPFTGFAFLKWNHNLVFFRLG